MMSKEILSQLLNQYHEQSLLIQQQQQNFKKLLDIISLNMTNDSQVQVQAQAQVQAQVQSQSSEHHPPHAQSTEQVQSSENDPDHDDQYESKLLPIYPRKQRTVAKGLNFYALYGNPSNIPQIHQIPNYPPPPSLAKK